MDGEAGAGQAELVGAGDRIVGDGAFTEHATQVCPYGARCLCQVPSGQQCEAERQARHDLAGPLELSPAPGPELVQLMGALERASERLASRPRHGSTAGRSGLADDFD